MIVVVATLTAHPRSRGENRCLGQIVAVNAGSSPLTRGKLEGVRRRGRVDRLIPAHAGKTPASKASMSVTAAHPRSRGENHGLPPPG